EANSDNCSSQYSPNNYSTSPQYKMSDESIYIHEYFDKKSADWNIMGFLDECTEKSYQLKINLYLKSLENIINNEQGSREKKAQLLYNKYKKNWEAEHKLKKLGSESLININNLIFLESDQKIRTISNRSFNIDVALVTLICFTIPFRRIHCLMTQVTKPASINLTLSEKSDDGNSSLVKDENDNSDKDDNEDIPDKIAKHVLTVL
ncbi:23171_t:CDS:2, partial [Rhizophagus irregularis]